MIVNKKNRNEKGTRALLILSNPHSNGELFSRSNTNFILRNKDKPKTTNTRDSKIKLNKIK